MRTFYIESVPEYGSYHFPYAHMAEIEAGEDLTPVYDAGFLPASANTNEPGLFFYRARSLRLDLRTFSLDKKRRYLQRRGTDAGLKWESIPLKTFLAAPPSQWKESLLQWVAARHDPPFMEAQRLDYVLDRPYLRHVAVIRREEEWVGLVLMPQSSGCAHYWFCFYNPECLPAYSLGKWILGETALHLKDAGYQHLYLGTVYGEKSRYKFQGISSGAEFFDGNGWSTDMTALLHRTTTDPA